MVTLRKIYTYIYIFVDGALAAWLRVYEVRISMKVCEKGRYGIGNVGNSMFVMRSAHRGLLYVENVG